VWGYHGAGDLGNGNFGLAGLPLPVPGLAGIVAVAAGQDFTLALQRDATVWALGYGAAGQMGNGALENANRPVQVVGLAQVKALAAGSMHALALKLDGRCGAGDRITRDSSAIRGSVPTIRASPCGRAR